MWSLVTYCTYVSAVLVMCVLCCVVFLLHGFLRHVSF